MSLISQHTGGKNYEKANKAAGQVFSLLLFVGLGISFMGFLGSHWILAFLVRVSQSILPLSTNYLQLMFVSLPFMFTFMASRFIFRAVGNMKIALYLRVISIVIDGVLNPLLILGVGSFPRWGVMGAGITNLLGRMVAAFTAVYLLFNDNNGVKLSLSDLRLESRWIKQIFRIGGPSTFSRGGSALAYVVITAFVAAFGTTSLSGYAIGRRITQLIYLGIWGFTSSVSTMVGQNVGAGKMDRAESIVRQSMLISAIITFTGAGFLFFIRKPLLYFFINDTAVVNEGASYITIFAFSIPFLGFFRIINSAYQGSGNTRSSMALCLGRLWILRIGLSYLLGFLFGWRTYGIYWGMSLSNFIIAGFSYPWFLTGNWKEEITN